jgi:Domain of unknown function (DUF4139)/N-terminal domain of unknown function (DUF4140)
MRMRKPIAISAFGVLLAAGLAAAGEKARLEPASRVDQVLLYSSGAAVRRNAKVKLPAGRSRVALTGLPPALIPGSLRARLSGPTGLRLVAVNYSLEPKIRPQKSDEIRLVKKLNELDGGLKRLNDERAILTAQAALLRGLVLPSKVKGAPHDKPKPPPVLEVNAWSKVLDFSQQNVAGALDQLRKLNTQSAKLEKEVGARQRDLARLQARSVPAVATALLDIYSPKAGNIQIALTYDVGNVAWYPTYSFHVDPVSGAAEMVRYAACAQNTGEDWTEAKLLFSTGEARRVAALPELRTWQIMEQVSGGVLEPSAAGNEEPGEEIVVQPGQLPAARAYLASSPLAGLGYLGAGRLRDAYGYSGLGSLGVARHRLRDAISDIPLGGSGVTGTMGVGGGGMAGCFGYRSVGGRKKAVARFGGCAATESSTEGSLGWLARRQRSDGSWSSQASDGGARMDEADTALSLLAFLGAGYTEKAGKYKAKVSAAVGYLVSRASANGAIGENLWTRALSATALSEAYGMSRVPATGRAAQRAVKALAREVGGNPWPLQRGLSGKVWPNGACNLALVSLAMKSAKVAGLAVDRGAILQVMSLLEDLEAAPPSPLNSAAALLIRQTLGYGRTDEANIRNAKTIVANLPRWRNGQIDYRYLYLGTMGMFQLGGSYWKRWNRAVRDMLVDKQVRSGSNSGSWSPIGVCGAGGGLPGSGASRVCSTALASMCLEVYYRYLPMYGASAHSSAGGTSGGADGGAAGGRKQYVPPIISSGGRDFRSRSLQPETLISKGEFKLVALERRKLRARTRYVATPVRYRGAFLEALAVNKSSEPLLAGEARLFLGSDYLGSVFMATVPPGARMTIPLGMDPEIKLARSSKSQRRESGFRRRLRRTTYEVKLQAANHKKRTIELVLVDRVPRPEDARIRVSDVSFRGGKPEYDPEGDSGKVSFSLKLKPGAVGSVGMTYVVEHPSNIEAVMGRTR